MIYSIIRLIQNARNVKSDFVEITLTLGIWIPQGNVGSPTHPESKKFQNNRTQFIKEGLITLEKLF